MLYLIFEYKNCDMTNFNEHPLAGKNDIDSAFSGGWAFYKKWFLPLYAISFVLALIVSVITSKIDISGLQYATDLTDLSAQIKSMMGIYALTAIVSLLINTLIQYYIIYRPLDPNFSIIDALGKVVVKYYFPLLVVYIIIGLFAVVAMTLGALMLFVGLLFAIPYVVLFIAMASPIMMVENASIDGTIRRLFKLVHKRFWPNMGWISVYIVLIMFFSFIIGSLVMLPFSGSIFRSLTDPDAASKLLEIATNPAYVLLSSLTTALTAPVMPILGLILYFNNSDTGSHIYNSEDTGTMDNINKPDDGNEDEGYTPTVDDLTP